MNKRKGSSLCDEDALPRYEISKMNKLAETDLEDISLRNQGQQDNLYGNGRRFGKDIDDQIKQKHEEGILSGNKQLAGPRKTIASSLKEHQGQSPTLYSGLSTLAASRNIPQNQAKKKTTVLPGLMNRKDSNDSLFMEDSTPDGLAFNKPKMT